MQPRFSVDSGGTQTVVVGGAIVDNLVWPTRLLAAQRSYPEQWRGYYEFPGGKVEAGETSHEALHREIREELGVEIQIGSLIPGNWQAHGGYPLQVYLCQLSSTAVPRPGDSHLGLDWISLSQALELEWLPADYPILRKLQEITKPAADFMSGE